MFVYFKLNLLGHSASMYIFFEGFRYSSQFPLHYLHACIRRIVSLSQSIAIFVVTAMMALYRVDQK